MLILFLCPLAFSEYIDMLDPRFKLPENQTPVFTDSKDPRNILQKYDQNFNPKLQDYLDPRVRQFDFLTSDFNQTTDFNILDLNFSLIGAPAGDTNQIQFNNGGVFGADENFQWKGSTNGGLLGIGQFNVYGNYPDTTTTYIAPPANKSGLLIVPKYNAIRMGVLQADELEDSNMQYGGIAMGASNNILNYIGIGIGIGNTVRGNSAVAIGASNNSNGLNSVAIGSSADTNNTYGIAIGNQSKAYGEGSTALGTYSQAFGAYSYATTQSTASGDYSIALGGTASGSTSTALKGGTASGTYSIAAGNTVTASGTGSFAQGNNSRALADYSQVRGLRVDANSYGMTTIGLWSPFQTTYNQTSFVSSDPLFWIANGESTTKRSVALSIRKDGNISIGWKDGNATRRFDVNAVNGYMRMAGDLNIVSHQNDQRPNLYVKANDGNVGINTSTPGQTLDINGNINVENDYYIKQTKGLTQTIGYINDQNYICWADYNSGLLTKITGTGCP